MKVTILSSTIADPSRVFRCALVFQGADKGKGKTNGTYKNKQRFTCDKDCGVFAPFSRIRPVAAGSLSRAMSDPHSQPDSGALAPGDRVVFFVDNKCRHGMVVHVEEENGKQYVRISTVSDPSSVSSVCSRHHHHDIIAIECFLSSGHG